MATEPLAPPPIRRIVLDDAPTVVHPPVVTNGDHTAVNPMAGLRRADRTPAEGVERMRTHGLGIAYGGKPAVKAVDLPVRQGEVLALIGPSGCGKTTLLRSLNRLTELTATAERQGTITLDGEDVDGMEVTELRKRVSMVFQQPNPLSF